MSFQYHALNLHSVQYENGFIFSSDLTTNQLKFMTDLWTELNLIIIVYLKGTLVTIVISKGSCIN